MASNPQNLNPQLVQPLNVGNVVSAGIQLYRTNFKQYFGIALVASLWAMLPFLLIVPAVLFYTATQSSLGNLRFLVLPWVVLLVYCLAKYSADSAAIARLAFGTLVNQPESTESAKRYTNARMWRFFNTYFLVFLVYIGIYIAAAVVVGIMLGVTGLLDLFTNPDPAALANNPGPVILAGLFTFLLLIAILVIFAWLSARFAIAELPLAIESGSTATHSIGRSWSLTYKNAWRVLLILFITFLITIPLQVLAQILVSTFSAILAVSVPPDSPSFTLISLAVSYILSFASGLLVLPLWQAIKAVIYSDLRSRREGLGLKLRDS